MRACVRATDSTYTKTFNQPAHDTLNTALTFKALVLPLLSKEEQRRKEQRKHEEAEEKQHQFFLARLGSFKEDLKPVGMPRQFEDSEHSKYSKYL
jgi:hypothetical protein